MAFDGHGSVSTSTEPKLKPVRPLGMINSHNPIIISHLTNNKTVGWGGGVLRLLVSQATAKYA